MSKTKQELAELAVQLFNNIDQADQFDVKDLFYHCDNAFLLYLIGELKNTVEDNDGQFQVNSDEELSKILKSANKVLKTSYKKSNDVSVKMLPPKPKNSLEEYTWDEIRQLSQMKINPFDYNIELGQSKDDKILVDMNHAYDGWTFLYKTSDVGCMNENNLNYGGYIDSDLRPHVEQLVDKVDSALRSVIKTVEIKCSQGSDKYNEGVRTLQAKFFLPSLKEMGFYHEGVPCAEQMGEEGELFDLFADYDEAVFKRNAITRSWWWMRSAFIKPYATHWFWRVCGDGWVSHGDAKDKGLIVAAFVVG